MEVGGAQVAGAPNISPSIAASLIPNATVVVVIAASTTAACSNYRAPAT